MRKAARILDPELLEVLVALAETRSFTETARLLERSQPSVSTAIRRLEEATTCALVSRSTHRVTLTADGEEMVRYARTVLGLSEEARRRFSRPSVSGAVRLGVFTNFHSMLLTGALKRFNARHASVQVTMEQHRSDILLSRFRDGMLDVILAAHPPGHGFGPPLWQDDLVWIGARALPSDRDAPVPLAVRVGPSMLRRAGTEALAVARRRHRICFEGNSYVAVAAAVDAGLGFSVFPRNIRPTYIPIIEPGLLPALGRMDVVLLKSAVEERDFVHDLHAMIETLSPQLFDSASTAIFGSGPTPPAPPA